MSNKIAIVIPTYNESKTIASVIKDIKKNIPKKSKYNIIVVNDGSADDTAKIAQKNGAIVINHILNSGAGSATATGLSYAQQNNYTIAATLDADGQHSAKDLYKGIQIIQNNNIDLLIGSRLLNSKGMPKIKLIGNWGLSTITKVLFGVKVTDSQSGMRILSKNALNNLKWKTSGYEFCSEMLWRANKRKLIIKECPIKVIYSEYSKSKGQNNWNGINIAKSLIHRRIVEIFE